MKPKWMSGEIQSYQDELVDCDTVDYDEYVFNRVFSSRTHQARRDWWLDRFEQCARLPAKPVYYRQYWMPHRSPATDHINGASYYSTAENDEVDNRYYWPWRTDDPGTLFKLLGLTRHDFRLPAWLKEEE